MNAIELVDSLREQGFTLTLLSEGRLSVRPADLITDELRQHIRQCKSEVLELLNRPHINERGELIIPFSSDPRYHWWAGGQSIRATLLELGAPPEVFARYVDSDATLKVQQ